MKFALHKITVIAFAAAAVTGCASVRAHKGAIIDPQLASAIQPGVDNKASVEKLLGRPTFVGDTSRLTIGIMSLATRARWRSAIRA